MFDISLKNVKKGYKFYLIFLIVGIIIFLVFGFIIFQEVKFYKALDMQVLTKNIDLEEEREDGEIMYSPIYHYIVDGKEYSCYTFYSSNIRPDVTEGIVYYSSKDPNKCITNYSIKMSKWFLLFFLLPTIFIIVGGLGCLSVFKKTKNIKKLNENGKLVKNLPYHLENSNMSVNNVPILRIVVEYKLKNGEIVTLKGTPRYDRKHSDSDGFVDLLIDEENPKNYFIDFEINRLIGNRKEDYYQDPNKKDIW